MTDYLSLAHSPPAIWTLTLTLLQLPPAILRAIFLDLQQIPEATVSIEPHTVLVPIRHYFYICCATSKPPLISPPPPYTHTSLVQFHE